MQLQKLSDSGHQDFEVIGEIVDVVENPLQRDKDQRNIMSIDDAQDFYLSDIDQKFHRIINGDGQRIRPLLFANNSRQLSFSRMNARYDPKKQLRDCDIIGYVYNPAWKDKLDAKQKPVPRTGRIDAFIKSSAPPRTSNMSSCTVSVTSTPVDELETPSAAQKIE